MSPIRRLKRLRNRNEKANVKRHRRRAMMESLEPRFLLSADFAPLAAAAMADGLDQLGDRMDSLLDEGDLFRTKIPFIVQVEQEGEDVRNVAPTLKKLISVPVDLNGNGTIDTRLAWALGL